ncbi:MAG TPA: hypothetical protein VHY91_16615 [Pirellulales bacterium]|nr:hypothetical protein [Pirellulales bacterium]
MEGDDRFYTVVRYVERNALRAKLVAQAPAWRWSSLWRFESGDAAARALLARWPLPRPRNWAQRVNSVQTGAELEAVRRAVVRGSPFGNAEWQQVIATRLGLQSTLRPRGRPKKSHC